MTATVALSAFVLGWGLRSLLDQVMTRVVTRTLASAIGKEKVTVAMAKWADKAA